MRAINYLFLAVLLLGGCTSMFGEDSVSEPSGLTLDQLDQALKLHITPEQLKEITRRAKQGDAIDQTFLGILYQNGWGGLPQHYQLAAKWFKLAAKQGDVGAQFNLGLMYHRGLGVPQNYQLAFKWSLLAAVQGNAIAQAELGDLYAFGKGVNQDIYEGLKWYTRAANQGNTDAQYQLGLVYYYGKGIPQNFVLAHKWINLAAAQGDKDAANSRAYLPNKMNTSQIQEAQRLAREFKPKKEKPKKESQ